MGAVADGLEFKTGAAGLALDASDERSDALVHFGNAVALGNGAAVLLGEVFVGEVRVEDTRGVFAAALAERREHIATAARAFLFWRGD